MWDFLRVVIIKSKYKFSDKIFTVPIGTNADFTGRLCKNECGIFILPLLLHTIRLFFIFLLYKKVIKIEIYCLIQLLYRT